MCGIIGKINKDGRPVNGSIIYNYIQQRNRGTRGFGFAYEDNGFISMRHNVNEEGIIKSLNRFISSAIIFHHRIPTSTENLERGCHPYKVTINGRNLYLIHNGVIINDAELFAKHQVRGYEYRSYDKKVKDFNDSETLAYDVAEVILNGKDAVECEGTIAFIAIETDNRNKIVRLHYGRNSGNPLKIVHTKHSILVGSEVDGTDVPANTLHTYSMKNSKVTTKPLKFPVAYNYKSHIASSPQSGQRIYTPGQPYSDDLYDYDDYRPIVPVKPPQLSFPLPKERGASKEVEIIGFPPDVNKDSTILQLAQMDEAALLQEIEIASEQIMSLESDQSPSEADQAFLSSWHYYYNALNEEMEYRCELAAEADAIEASGIEYLTCPPFLS